MSGRALAFSDDDIVRMAQEDYVAVAADDWYQRRRQDDEGEFFRRVADQGPRRGSGTRQGIYLLTADGHLLGYKNAGQAPDVMRDVLRQGLGEWAKLPESHRRPGAVQVGEPKSIDQQYHRPIPRNALVAAVHARLLDRTPEGEWVDADCQVGNGNEASTDHLWLTESEWRSLVPKDARPGRQVPLPKKVAERLVRFHLVDNTRGEPPFWRREDLRRSELALTVLEADADGVRLRLEGSALVSTHADPDKADRGYEARLLGFIDFDRGEDRITRFDVVAVGDHWGEGTYTRGARPGRTPLGVAIELARRDAPDYVIPPQAARNPWEYFDGPWPLRD